MPYGNDTTGGGTVALVVNDQDLADFGFVVGPEGLSGVLDAPASRVPTGKVVGRPGEVKLAMLPETDAREIRVTGTMMGTDVDHLVARADWMKQWLVRGGTDLELRTGYDLTRYYRGMLTGCVITTVAPQMLTPYATVQLTFRCADPRAYGSEALVVGFAQGRAPCPLGTAPSEPVIRIMGPASNPVVTYRKANGEVAGTHGFVVDLDTTSYLGIATPTLSVAISRNGVEADAIEMESSGDFLTLSPDDGDPAVGAWPTLETSSGTGEALWRRVYL